MVLRRPGKVYVRPRFFLTDRHGVPQEDITRYVAQGSVDLDINRPVSPLLLRGELLRRDLVEPYRDHIQPWLRLEYPNGLVVDEPVGLYAVAPPRRRSTYGSTRATFEARDHTWRLATSYLTAPYTVAAGSNVVETVRAILVAQGFSAGDIALGTSPKLLLQATTWGIDAAVSWLTVVNDLLGAIAWTPVHTIRAGQLRSFAVPDLEAAEPDKRYDQQGGEITSEITEDPDVERVCNVVRVLNDRNGADPIVAIAENHNPASPVSIPNLEGRRIYREIQDANIPDQATANAIALAALQEGATYQNRVTITTASDPTRNPYEIYGFALQQRDSTSVLAGNWRCTGWTLGLNVPDVAMRHQIGKVVPV